MTLMIELPPELEGRLKEEAAKRGQDAAVFAMVILEERLAQTGRRSRRRPERTPEQIVSDFFTRIPRRSPEDLLKLARQQGIQPVKRFEDLLGEGPAEGDEFDIDAFRAARQQWQREDRLPGMSLFQEPEAHP